MKRLKSFWKKAISVATSIATVLSASPPIPANAANSGSLASSEYTSGITSHFWIDSNTSKYGKFAENSFEFRNYTIKDSSGNVRTAYCIEHGAKLSPSFSGQSAAEYGRLTSSQKDLINEAMLFGYQFKSSYGQSQSVERAATQLLIWVIQLGYWNTSVETNVVNAVAAQPKNSGIKTVYYQIKNLMTSYEKIPSFARKSSSSAPTYTLTYDSGSKTYKTTLTDSNNVLSNFPFSGSGVSMSVSGNKLTITSSTPNLSNVVCSAQSKLFSQAQNANSGVVFWYSSGGQDMVGFTNGRLDPVQAYFKLNTGSPPLPGNGQWTMFKTTEDGSPLEGAEFTIRGGAGGAAKAKSNVAATAGTQLYSISEDDQSQPKEQTASLPLANAMVPIPTLAAISGSLSGYTVTSDTDSYTFTSIGQAYTFGITVSPDTQITAGQGNGSVISVDTPVKVRSGFYTVKVHAVGEGGTSLYIQIGGQNVLRIPVNVTTSVSVTSDTSSYTFTSIGQTYTFRINVSPDAKPSVTQGNGSVVSADSVTGGNGVYYVKVHAVGEGNTSLYVSINGTNKLTIPVSVRLPSYTVTSVPSSYTFTSIGQTYTFRINVSPDARPTVTQGNGSVVSADSVTGSNGTYNVKVHAVGEGNTSLYVSVNGTNKLTIPVSVKVEVSLSADTSSKSLRVGESYTVGITVSPDMVPTCSQGNGSVIDADAPVKVRAGYYTCRVKAVGEGSTSLYISAGDKQVRVSFTVTSNVSLTADTTSYTFTDIGQTYTVKIMVSPDTPITATQGNGQVISADAPTGGNGVYYVKVHAVGEGNSALYISAGGKQLKIDMAVKLAETVITPAVMDITIRKGGTYDLSFTVDPDVTPRVTSANTQYIDANAPKKVSAGNYTVTIIGKEVVTSTGLYIKAGATQIKVLVRVVDGIQEGEVVFVGKTDASGHLAASLPPGNYTWEESAAPDGYILDNTKHAFTVSEGGVVTATMTNKSVQHHLIIYKSDESGSSLAGAVFQIVNRDSGAVVYTGTTSSNGQITTDLPVGSYTAIETQAPDGYDLAASQDFDVTASTDTVRLYFTDTKTPPPPQKHTVRIYKTDSETGSPLAGATIEITNDQTGEKVFTGTTDDSGMLSTTLDTGSYTATEIKAPDGYKIDESQQRFDVEDDTQIVRVNFSDTKEQQNPGTIEIYKVDETGGPLKGAEFQITNASGQIVYTGTTDASGKLSTTLPVGSYTATETKAPTGYQVNVKSKNFTISKSDEVIKLTFEDTKLPDKTGEMDILKVDSATNGPLEGATFEIKDSTGKTVYTGTTGKDGKLSATLAPGTYTVTETQAPEGYTIDKSTQEVTVQADKTVTLNFSDTKVLGGITLAKTDSTDSSKKLKGATFEVFADTNNNQTYDKGTDKSVGTMTDNGDGTYVISKLAPGLYFISETKAPEGYQLSTEIVSAEITSEQTTITVPFEDAPNNAKIVLNKKGNDGNSPLEGVTFRLAAATVKDNDWDKGDWTEDTSSSFQPVTAISDKDGKAVFDNVPYGHYLVTETKGPDGYQILEVPLKITLDGTTVKNGEYTRTVYNKVNPALPATGSIGYIIPIAIGACLGIGLIVYAVISFRKRRGT